MCLSQYFKSYKVQKREFEEKKQVERELEAEEQEIDVDDLPVVEEPMDPASVK